MLSFEGNLSLSNRFLNKYQLHPPFSHFKQIIAYFINVEHGVNDEGLHESLLKSPSPLLGGIGGSSLLNHWSRVWVSVVLKEKC